MWTRVTLVAEQKHPHASSADFPPSCGNPFTVVGVLQPDFIINSEALPSKGPMDRVDILCRCPWHLTLNSLDAMKTNNNVARLKPGVSVKTTPASFATQPSAPFPESHSGF